MALVGPTIGLLVGITLHQPALTLIFGVLTALPAAIAVVLALSARRNRTPLLRICDQGLIHRSIGLIAWSEVHGLQTTEGPEGRTLHIEINDPTYMLSSRRPDFMRRILPDHPSLEVTEEMIDMPLEDVRDAISHRLRKSSGE